MRLRHLPNILTIGRLFLVPAMIWMILEGRLAAAFWIFLVAGVTDAVDGILARLLDARTVLGGYLDPLADKLLLVATFLLLGVMGQIDFWVSALIISRDIMIVGGVLSLHLVSRTAPPQPIYISKVNTVAQIALAALVLAHQGVGIGDWGLTLPMIYVVAATTVASGLGYLIVWSQRMAAPHPVTEREEA